MDRRDFISGSIISFIAMQTLSGFRSFADSLGSGEDKMPVLFVGHGSPMNAIEQNEFTKSWIEMGKSIPKPKAVLCISAHWETKGTKITAMPKPPTIHDFGGFPRELNEALYPAPGNPELAKQTAEHIKKTAILLDQEWGLDHGCWSVLKPMFPDADIPVLQMSIDYTKSPEYHFELAKELAYLRSKGVLILGSGNIVHNLRMLQWQTPNGGYDWAKEFNDKIKGYIQAEEYDKVVRYKELGKAADLSVPSNEHFIPLLYSLALREKNEKVSVFNDKAVMGSITMTSYKIG